eukprot:CAMPEP_0181081918 /NCGR_PEP_ID=MMETSP1071-20121207/3349_1 /TAXON_ID=35127 /ORGANISM="Thalassiosira sp., Strain NH16" /LENGTH=203 /DNA_ID=CAMNT_0023163479 /DNA_START=234 /DNA_END=841 /DNA_ORIENTATION=-
MANRYDDVERKFGVSAYASPHDGFAAVVKARYSDFVVHEVDLNGNVARLDSLETPNKTDTKSKASAETNNANSDTAAENTRKRKLSEGAADLPSLDATVDNKVHPSPHVDWDSRKQDLTKLIGGTPAQETVTFLQLHETDIANDKKEQKDNDVQKFYTLPLISDKQTRRSIHLLMKSPAFNLVARADNHDGRIRIWHKRFEAA